MYYKTYLYTKPIKRFGSTDSNPLVQYVNNNLRIYFFAIPSPSAKRYNLMACCDANTKATAETEIDLWLFVRKVFISLSAPNTYGDPKAEDFRIPFVYSTVPTTKLSREYVPFFRIHRWQQFAINITRRARIMNGEKNVNDTIKILSFSRLHEMEKSSIPTEDNASTKKKCNDGSVLTNARSYLAFASVTCNQIQAFDVLISNENNHRIEYTISRVP